MRPPCSRCGGTGCLEFGEPDMHEVECTSPCPCVARNARRRAAYQNRQHAEETHR